MLKPSEAPANLAESRRSGPPAAAAHAEQRPAVATGRSLPYMSGEVMGGGEHMKYVWRWIVMATVAAILIGSFVE